MLNIDEDGAQGTAGETSVAVEIVALNWFQGLDVIYNYI